MDALRSPAQVDETAQADEAVEHLRSLLRFDTTNPPGNERPAIDYVARALAREGVEARIFEPAPGRANLVARLRGDGSLPPLLLASHVDVVMAEPARWTHGPFSADVAEGYVYGRGAVDMKGMTAFELTSFLSLHRAKEKLRRDVILCVLADEEAGMTHGSKWMVENEPDQIRAEYALNEVGGFTTTVGGRRLYLVGTGEKGMCWLRLRASGDPGHGSMPHERNAVLALASALSALGRARLSSHLRPASRRFLEEVASAIGFPGSLIVNGLLGGLTREASLRALARMDPAQARVFAAMVHQTATPTGLRAGEKENVIPSRAEAIVDGRFLPGTSRDDFIREVRAVTGDAIEVEVIHSGEPSEVPIEGPLFETIAAKVALRDPGARAVPWLNVGFTDACHLSRLGTRCYGFYPLRLPPDLKFAELFHGHDERVPLDGYRFGMGLFHDVVRSFARGA